MSKLEAIMDIFQAHGKAETPVAIIQDGTTEKEKKVFGTVKDIVFKAQYAEIANPAIIIVGEVVKLSSSDWQQNLSSLDIKSLSEIQYR